LNDASAKSKFDAKREAALVAFKERYPEQGSRALEIHLNDALDKMVWVGEAYGQKPISVGVDSTATELFDALREQRLAIQKRYAKWKLNASGDGLQWKSMLSRITLNALTLVLPLVAAGAAAMMIFYGLNDQTAQAWTIVTVIVSSLIVGIRALADGFQWTEEDERYELSTPEQNQATAPA
jgi:hypothetical protein